MSAATTMSNTTEPRAGLELGGGVRLLAELGRGGLGSVWIAQHLATRTKVAVKFVARHLADDPGAATRLKREATDAARIASPHVTQILEHGMSEEWGPYIVTELLEGETLSAFVRRHGALSPELTCTIIAQLCKGLSKAHAEGVVHREIKPENVFLVDSEQEVFVKLLDFGVAKILQDDMDVASPGSTLGTPHYSSPEQIFGSKHVDARSDLWAVGVVAYYCITGALPFDGGTFGAIASAIAQGRFAPPHVGYGYGSPALDAWFVRALSRERAGRFASARELSDALFVAISSSYMPIFLPASVATQP